MGTTGVRRARANRADSHPPAPPAWGGRLFLAPGVILYLGPGAVADEHAHHAVQLVWASEGEVTLRCPSRTTRVRAALVPASLPHSFEAQGQPLALLLVERHGPRGAALDRRAREDLGRDLHESLSGVRFPSLDLGPGEAMAWCESVFTALGVASTGVEALSRTTRRAITYIEGALDTVPSLADAAARASVSPTRLTHCFSAEVGIPFRRFVLWARLKRAVEETRRGASLTEAAVEAGFSDAAHLSRTFRAMFGLSPSMVLPLMEFFGGPWGTPDAPSR